MKSQSLKLAWVVITGITLIGASSCRNTAHGVVKDTKHNTEKVGEGMQEVGHDIQKATH